MIVKFKDWIIITDENKHKNIPNEYNRSGFIRYKRGSFDVTPSNVEDIIDTFVRLIMIPKLDQCIDIESSERTIFDLHTALLTLITQGSYEKIGVNSYYPTYNELRLYLHADPTNRPRITHTLIYDLTSASLTDTPQT